MKIWEKMNKIIALLLVLLPLMVPLYISAQTYQQKPPGFSEQIYVLWVIAISLIALNGKIVFDWFKFGRKENGSIKKDIQNLDKCMEYLVDYHKRMENNYIDTSINVKWLREKELEKISTFKQLAENSLLTNILLESIQKGIDSLNFKSDKNF